MANGVPHRVSLRLRRKKRIPTRAPGFVDAAAATAAVDDDDVAKVIAREASKNKALSKFEEQHKKALEEDPSAFDYDGVYDKMKEKEIQPRLQDLQERKSKYIETLMAMAKERERQHRVVYERKLAKERDRDAHLYGDKDKYVTSAYKKSRSEMAKWEEEDSLRQRAEEKDDVTKKRDLSDFYWNLQKNVAFGAMRDADLMKSKMEVKEAAVGTSEKVNLVMGTASNLVATMEKDQGETSKGSKLSPVPVVVEPVSAIPELMLEEAGVEPIPHDQPQRGHHKISEDQVSAAKERFLARKRAKVK